MTPGSSLTAAPAVHPEKEKLGRVSGVDGSQATVTLESTLRAGGGERQATVGKFLGIVSEGATIIGLITQVGEEKTAGSTAFRAIAHVDLIGEIRTEDGSTFFQRGIADYPLIGSAAVLIDENDLRLIYGGADADHAHIGNLQQNENIGVNIDIDNLVSKHFAILGTTGVGKSSGVAIILQKILESRPNLRLFLVDPHNEYGRCFGDKAQVLTPRNLRLPFWLFNFEEFIDVIFGARPGVDEEIEILSEVIPLAKSAYLQYRNGGGTAERSLAKKRDPKDTGFTADTPVPYRIEDLMNLLDQRMGKLENRTSRVVIHKLMSRIQTYRNHPRYAFMFENANIGGDTMAETLSSLFRLPTNGKPMTIMQLAGFPAEVVDSVVSVLCRMAFDFGLWSDGVAPLLFVCEEAHRYAPADKKIGFGPTRRALSRIAKEGRKYGVFLGLVTQRPAEIDPTIISQCSTLFVMRLANDRDQGLIRSAVSDAAANLLSFIPTLGTREVFAFGSGVALPTRLRFNELAADKRPASESAGDTRAAGGASMDQDFLMSVIDRWRSATMSHKGGTSFDDDDFGPSDFGAAQPPSALPGTAPSLAPSAPPLDPNRLRAAPQRPAPAAPPVYDPNRPRPVSPASPPAPGTAGSRILKRPLEGSTPSTNPPGGPLLPSRFR
jgi:DNA helicase HerA-like ATPase